MDVMRLKELHDEIKDHPYRLHMDESTVGDYAKLLLLFSKESIKVFKEFNIENGVNCTSWYVPYAHDFNMSVSAIRNNYSIKSSAIMFVESVLQQFHYFIDNGVFNRISTNLRVSSNDDFARIDEDIYSKKYNRWFNVYENKRTLENTEKYWKEWYVKNNKDYSKLKEDFDFIRDHFLNDDETIVYE